MKKFVISVLLLLLFSSSSAIAADWYPETWVNRDLKPGWGYRIADKIDTRNSGISAGGLGGTLDSFGRGGMSTCDSLTDIKCAGAASFRVTANLGVCKDQIDSFSCIEYLELNKSDLTLDSYISESQIFAQDVSALIPAGSSFEVWKTKGISPRYFASMVQVTGIALRLSGMQISPSLTFTIQEVKPIPCVDCTSGKLKFASRADDVKLLQDYTDIRESTGECYLATQGICYESVEMNLDETLGISVRLPTKWASWFFGRIESPEISSGKTEIYSKIQTRSVRISGKPISVPIVGEYTTDSLKIPNAYLNRLTRDAAGAPIGTFSRNLSGATPGAWEIGLNWTSIGDKANASSNTWSVRAMTQSQNSACSIKSGNGSVLGIIYTNSLLYSDTAPIFSDLEFKYRVGGRHLDAKGAPLVGMYGLAIASDYAECLYGKAILNAEATLTIQDVSTGEKKVTTSLAKTSGEFFNFYTSGFTFSTKEIGLKLNLPEVRKATPTPKPLAQAQLVNPKKLTTITCIKGKATKKVTAIKPTCPAGYKKK